MENKVTLMPPSALAGTRQSRAARTIAYAVRRGCGCGGGPAPLNVQRGIAAWVKALALICLFVQGQAALAQNWQILLPMVPSADSAALEGFVRIVNPISRDVPAVHIRAVDDAGSRFGPVSLSLSAREAVNFNSRDLERGNASKGLPVGVGDGVGHWRLEFDTSQTSTPLALAYIRTADEFVTSMHGVVSPTGNRRHVPIFNPGSNRNQRSRLRLINPGSRAAEVTIAARDDAGRSAPGGGVSLILPAGEARTFTVQELESGGSGFSGRLGNGAGKWQLFVSADRPIEVMNLLASPTGHLANLSTSGFREIRVPIDLREIRVPIDLREIRVPIQPDQPSFRASFRDCPECPEMVVVPPIQCAADPSLPAGRVCPESEIMVAPPMEYTMGSMRGGDGDERPTHPVTIDAPFSVGRYEITFSQWDECHEEGGCRHRPDDQGWGRGSRPVVDVNWHDAQEYVQWLSGKTGWRYRLLSESEWEYVARAGTRDNYNYWWGGSIGRNRANCDGCRSRWDDDMTAPVGSFRPNPFGLYDVHGNVWELVEDCGPERIGEHDYRGAPDDGSAWRSGDCDYRAVRGGGWNSPPEHLRSANRGWIDPRDRGFPSPFDLDRTVGFRVARTLAPRRQTLPLIPPASNPALEGFVRIINRSNQAGTVRIHAVDDTGRRFGPVSLSLSAKEAVNVNSRDLERGNASKGLPAGVGDGEGYWRLELDNTALAIDPLAYIRTTDGFVTSIHDVAPLTDTDPDYSYYVPFSNPGGNRNQRSWLRLINPGAARADVWIIGRDDEGEPAPEGDIRFTLPAGEARTFTAQELESGASGFSGRLGDGAGKWQLFIGADRPIEVMSLLMSPTGHLANLSTSPNGALASPPPPGVP